METVLSIKNLSKHFGRIKAVDELSLEVKKGQVFGLLGPNGSGKTTTLGIILDVVNKSSGEYCWFDKPSNTDTRKKIGAILESPIFYPYLSAAQNLRVVAEIKKVPTGNIEKVLTKVGLYDRRHDNFKTYSLGMKQRLAIASALLCDPIVMILDEPTNGLDPQGIAEIRELIIQIAAEGKTIILASHLLDEVQKVCSHFAILKKGKMVYQGKVEDVNGAVESVEVASENIKLLDVLRKNAKITNIDPGIDKHLLTLAEGYTSTQLNQYLFDNEVVASLLLTKRKSLEKQFLEILSE